MPGFSTASMARIMASATTLASRMRRISGFRLLVLDPVVGKLGVDYVLPTDQTLQIAHDGVGDHLPRGEETDALDLSPAAASRTSSSRSARMGYFSSAS